MKAAQRNLRRRVQARLEPAVRRDADAATAVAEAVAHGPDEAHVAHPTGDVPELRHAVAAQGHKARHGLKHHLRRDEARLWPAGAGPHGHELDETHVDGLGAGQLCQARHVDVVDAAHEHAVDLGAREARVAGSGEAGQGVLKASAARELGVAGGVQRVQADVQPV